MALRKTAFSRWTSDDLKGLLALILAVVFFLLTADFKEAAARIERFREWANPVVEAGALAASLLVLAFVGYHAVNLLLRFSRWSVRKIATAVEQYVRRLLTELSASVDSHAGRLTIIEQGLGIGNHAKLNLPDHWPPEMVERAVRVYGRRHAYGEELLDAVQQLVPQLREDGYIVMSQVGPMHADSWHTTRRDAEAGLARHDAPAVLIHVIRDDWRHRR